jgi:hypothetical protein
VNKKANRAEPDTKSKTIADLKHAIEKLVSRQKKPEELEGIIAEAKTLARRWKNPHSAHDYRNQRPLFDGTTWNDTTFLLVGLVVLLSPDHHRLELIRRHYPNELEKLTYESSFADIKELAWAWKRHQPELPTKQKYERDKRRSMYRGDVGLIEHEFGRARQQLGQMDPMWQELVRLVQWPPAVPPACLDDIFAGNAVNMLRLEKLFGLNRHRLAESLRGVQKRRYDYLAVVKIMDFLLKKKPRKKGKRPRPGRPPPMPWLNDRDLRMRVLSGIEARINSLSVRKEIAIAFLAIVHRHLPNSGKK